MVTRLDAGDARPHLLHDARSLVASNHRESRHDVAVPQMLVRMAEASGHEAHQDLVILRGVEVQLGDLPVLLDAAEYGSSGFHRARLESNILFAGRT